MINSLAFLLVHTSFTKDVFFGELVFLIRWLGISMAPLLKTYKKLLYRKINEKIYYIEKKIKKIYIIIYISNAIAIK